MTRPLAIAGTVLLLGIIGACRAATVGPSGSAPIDGRWVATITEADGTQLDVRMTFSADGDKIDAFSRPGGVRDAISWRTWLLGTLLFKLPPHGALLRVEARRLAGDSIAGSVMSPFLRAYQLRGVVRHDSIVTMLQPANTPSAPTASLVAIRSASAKPLRDYSSLAQHVKFIAKTSVYDPALAESAPWQRFFAAFEERMARAVDDLDAVVAFNSRVADLGSSHWGFIHNPRIAVTPFETLLRGDSTILPDTLVTLSFPAAGIAWLRVAKWERVTEAVDRAFARIDSANIKTLILDIRSNPGGDATSAVPAAHLLGDSTPVGVFLGARWYATHRQPPSSAERARLPLLTSDSSGPQLIRRTRDVGAVSTMITPRAPRFRGDVYLLIDGATASASEPLAHVLKTTHRATLIGQRTAGKMLTALPHDLGDGWIVLLPEADFIAVDGTRLEGNGVTPDVPTAFRAELIAVADRIQSQSALGAALLRGAGNLTLRQFTEAERWYGEAARLSPDSIAAVAGLVNVALARQQWPRAFELVDARLKSDSLDPGAVNLAARVALASAQRLEPAAARLRLLLASHQSMSRSTQAIAHKRLGLILRALGDSVEARRQLQTAVSLDHTDPESISALARMR